MKMDNMVKILEKQGFKAQKDYDPRGRVYIFTISKDGCELKRNFYYPEFTDYRNVDTAQRNFLKNLVNSFNNRYSAEHPEKEKPMKNIDWKTRSIDIDFGSANNVLPVVTAKVDGIVHQMVGSLSPTDIGNMLDDVLNGQGSLSLNPPQIKDVIFNPPATIVFWTDNTKTVVKAQAGEPFDAEKGLAMAYMKKTMGNKGNYFNTVKKWTENYSVEETYLDEVFKRIKDEIDNLVRMAILAGEGKADET